MATAVKRKLSGSTDGKAIKVTGTDTANTVTVHTAVAGTTAGTFDEVWVYAYNGHSAAVVVTVEWGAADAWNVIKVSVPNQSGLLPIVPGFILQNGTVVKVFAATADVIGIHGFVNSITD